ncbi:hypothetical protein VTP01DRAFT_5848 [Rhizomucor pusillus]|uniref:uncharacterized protein n=1 Tax=Rhizomucor pusillus TaxID=4840 RepID=UPI0037429559
MDIKYLLCHPSEPLPYAAPTGYAGSFDPLQQQSIHDLEKYSLRCMDISYLNKTAFNPPSPPQLVRSRTSSDASSACSDSPRDWAYSGLADSPPGRDEENTFMAAAAAATATTRGEYYDQMHFAFGVPSTSTRSSSSDSAYASASEKPRKCLRSTSTSSAGSSTVQTRMAWTPYEDELLQRGYDEGLSWAMISTTYLPHRSRGCCWGRFKTLQGKNMVDTRRHSNVRLFRRSWKANDKPKRS